MEIQSYQIHTIKELLKGKNYEITLSTDDKLLYLTIKDIPNFGDKNFCFNFRQVETILLFNAILKNY